MSDSASSVSLEKRALEISKPMLLFGLKSMAASQEIPSKLETVGDTQ